MDHFSVVYKPDQPVVYNSSGVPAWPVYTKRDILTFQKVCDFYGVEWRLENNYELSGNHKKSPEEYVVAIGERYRKEAFLYAHLTNRHALVLADMNELLSAYQPAYTVILAHHKDLTASSLERIYTTDQVTAPGLLLDYADGNFFRQVLFKSLLYRITASTRNDATVVDFLPTSQTKFFMHENFIMGGNDLDAKSIKHILKLKKALLNIVTHSDGIDAYLGKLTLCPLKEIKKQQVSPPLCISSGICHRTHQSITHVTQKDVLISPSGIKANILLWLTCRGIRLLPSSINPAWGILPVFANNPFIGGIATSWKIIYTNLEMMVKFSSLLNECGTLGKAVAAFNASEQGKTTNLKLSVIGDPNCSFQGNPTMEAVHQLISGKEIKTVRPENTNTPAYFIQHYLKTICEKNGNGNDEEIRKCLHLLNEQQVEKKQKRQITESLRKRILEIISHQKSEAVVDYVKQARHIRISGKKSICPHCQTKTDTHSISFSNEQIEKRWVTICPCCGIIEDRDQQLVPVYLKMNESKISLVNHTALKTNFDAVVKYDFKLKNLCKVIEWPKDDKGFPEEHIPLDRELYPGPLYVTLFVLQDLNFSMTRFPYRQEISASVEWE